MADSSITYLSRDLIINKLIQQKDYKSYLEIGIQYKYNWNLIKCQNMAGVEPAGDLEDDRIVKTTSDGYFATHTDTFDIIFIDGDHNAPTVSRDIANSLKVLNPGGTIVLHDTYPPEESDVNPCRCGTVYQAVWQLRQQPGYDILTYQYDFGVCLVKPGQTGKTIHPVTTYSDYVANAKEIINLKSTNEEFMSALKEW